MKASVFLAQTGRPVLDVSLTFSESNTVFGLTGKSGAGKTTLLRCLCQLEPDASTEIEWATTASQPRIAMVFQLPVLLPHLRVEQSLALAMKYGQSDKQLMNSVLSLCQCEHLLKAKPDTLSGGEAQRVALACALLNRPDVLLLDEGLSALDRTTRRQILSDLIVFTKKRACKVLMVSHDLEDLMLFTEEMALIDSGNIQYCGPVAQAVAQLNSSATCQLANLLPIELCEGESLDGYVVARYQGHRIYARKTRLSQTQNHLIVNGSDIVIEDGSNTTSSLVNTFPGVVTAICALNEYDVKVTLQCDTQTVFAVVDAMVVAQIKLREGKAVHLCFNPA